MRRWIRNHHRAATALVSLLILALLPTPLPRVEYHNVRHHDAPGEICEYHDHLLRWHANAGVVADVAILHWHWGWLAQDGADAEHSGRAPRVHAFHPMGAVEPVERASTLAVRAASPTVDRLPTALPLASTPLDLPPILLIAPAIPDARAATALVAVPSRLALHVLHRRWSC